MLGQHTGDVIVDHDHIVDMPEPLLGEHADGGRAAADPHQPFLDAIDDGRPARLHDHVGAMLALPDHHLHRLAVAEPEERVAGHPPLGLAAAGQMLDPAERQHLRTVFRGHRVTNRLALDPHHVALMADMPVGVDLHLDAAIGEDALGHHRHHVNACDLLADDEGGRLVVGIGGARANRGDERAVAPDDIAVPVVGIIGLHEGHELLVRGLQHGQRIEPDQLAAVIRVAIARTGLAVGNVAHHRTGIAADLFGLRALISHRPAPAAWRAGAPVSPAAG